MKSKVTEYLKSRVSEFQKYSTKESICHHSLQLWGLGLQFAADVVLEGLAKAGVKGRCTVMGRSAMSLDLQGLQKGLQARFYTCSFSSVISL